VVCWGAMDETRLLIVEDHPLFAEGFAHMARGLRPRWRLSAAASAEQAIAAFGAVRPDIAIVDVMLPDVDGFELLRRFADLAPTLPVILISGREDLAVRVRARAMGAHGFIAKSEPPDAICAAIDAVLAGGTRFESGAADEMPAITQRQAEILELLADGHGNKEIRHRLGIAERTVRAHITELFQLLGAHSRTQALLKARQMGLIA
jgi:DNA-binding NarL/FixJ family response regulator